MATVDLSSYVSLQLFDKDPQDLINSALGQLAVDLPAWQPREGNTEMLILEALALENAELILAINRLPAAIMQALLLLFGIPPSIGTQPTALVQFNLADTSGHLIPIGTRVQLALPATSVGVLTLSTNTDLLVPMGSQIGIVLCTGDLYTDAANGSAVGTNVVIIDQVSFADSAELATAPSGGTDPETSATWLQRASNALSRLSNALVLPQHFSAAALESTSVSRALAIDDYDPSSGNSPGVDGGHITVAVYGPTGLVSDADKATLALTLSAQAETNLAVHVIDATVTSVDINIIVVPAAGSTPAQAISSATTAITTWLDPQTWPWTTLVRINSLIGIISASSGVLYVETVETPSTDIVLPGVANLTIPGSILVFSDPAS
jgi:uncharacterized phage protein gp47/JayE